MCDWGYRTPQEGRQFCPQALGPGGGRGHRLVLNNYKVFYYGTRLDDSM